MDVIERHNAPEVLIYADPPYHPDTRTRRLYSHEMSDSDHADLLEALKNHLGPVLLSGYDCRLYNEALPNWQRREIDVRAQNNAVRREVLWLNPIATSRLTNDLPLMKLMEAA